MMNLLIKVVPGLLFCISLLACNGEVEQGSATISISSVTPQESAVGSFATFQDLEGNPVELANFLGKRIFLNYWATWCAPCIREIPSIARAAAKLGDDDFVFLLASDESLEEINTFVEEYGFSGNFIKLNAFFASHGVEAVPSSFLYNAEGIQVNGWLGEREWDSSEVLAELRE